MVSQLEAATFQKHLVQHHHVVDRAVFTQDLPGACAATANDDARILQRKPLGTSQQGVVSHAASRRELDDIKHPVTEIQEQQVGLARGMGQLDEQVARRPELFAGDIAVQRLSGGSVTANTQQGNPVSLLRETIGQTRHAPMPVGIDQAYPRSSGPLLVLMIYGNSHTIPWNQPRWPGNRSSIPVTMTTSPGLRPAPRYPPRRALQAGQP